MAKESVEELLSHAGGSVYRLIRIAARRALEISEGQPILIKNPSSDKATTIALEEIAQGKVVYKNGKGSGKSAQIAPVQETQKEEASAKES